MSKKDLHPVDEFFLSHIRERKEDLSFKEENWKTLVTRLDENDHSQGETRKADVKENIFRAGNLKLITLLSCVSLIILSFFYRGFYPRDLYREQIMPSEAPSVNCPDSELSPYKGQPDIQVAGAEALFLLPEKEVNPGSGAAAVLPLKNLTEPDQSLSGKVTLPLKSEEAAEKINPQKEALPFADPAGIPASLGFKDEEFSDERANDSIFIFW